MQQTSSIGMRLLSKYGEVLLILAIWIHVLGYMFELWKRYQFFLLLTKGILL